MPFIISDSEEIEEDENENPQQGKFLIEDAQDEPFSPVRALAGSAEKFVGGLPRAPELFRNIGQYGAQQLLDSITGQTPQSLMDRLQKSGYSEEDIEGFVNELYGEQDSIGSIIGMLTGGSFEAKNPLERILQGAAEGAGEFIGFDNLLPGGSGASKFFGAAKSGALFGGGATTAEEAGAGPIGQFFAGLGATGLPSLLKMTKSGISGIIDYGKNLLKSKGIPEGTPKFLTESQTPKALADLELSQKNLSGRLAQISGDQISHFENKVGSLSEPIFKDTADFSASNLISEINNSNRKHILDTIIPVNTTEKKGWEAVKGAVEENYDAAKTFYRRMYESSESDAAKIKMIPNETFSAGKALEKDMKGSLLSTAEEGSIKSAATNLVKKLIPSQEKNAANLVADLAEEGIIADYESVLSMMTSLAKEGNPRLISIDRLMNTNRSISRILSKSNLIPAPVDLLKKVQKAIKQDIYSGLSEKSPETLNKWLSAENAFGKTRNTFVNDAITKLRKIETPEDLTSFFTKPSNIQKLNQAIGNSRQHKDLFERMIVEHIASKSTNQAKELAKESQKYLSDKSNKALQNLIEYADTNTPIGSREVTRSALLSDIQKSVSDGTRPTYALNLMKNPSGYNLVKESLNRSKSGRKIFESLQSLTMKDIMESIIDPKSKMINYEKAKDIFSNPHLKNIIREAGGEEMLNFFQNLQKMGQNFYHNINTLKIKEPKVWEKLLDTYLSSQFKNWFAVLMPQAGVPLLLGGEGIKAFQRRRLFKILESKKGRSLLEKLGRKGSSPRQTAENLKKIAQFSSQIETDE